MKILVANLGSTSLKYRLFDFLGGAERLVTRGGFERVTDYRSAIESCLAELQTGGFIKDGRDLAAVGFKPILAQGITGCVRMDETVLRAMEACVLSAPAHNPPYITGVRLFSQIMPGTPMIGLFETAFYQWAPEAAMRYAVPDSWLKLGVRRWGYHGASHKFIAERSAELLGRPDVAERARRLYVDGPNTPVQGPNLRVVSCHLGGSSSVTGILNGVGIGNSLGMTPQSGLPHNNRVGDLDSFALPLVMRSTGMTLDEAERQLCKESGLKGVGGYNDVRDLETQASQGDAKAQLALDMLAYHARHWIGAYMMELNGLDALVFTAGIAENSKSIRAAICRNAEHLGLELDPEKNYATTAQEAVISKPNSRVKIMVIPANEELVIAREAKRFLEAGK